MAIPQTRAQQTPTRALTEYTVGNPDTRVDLSTAASSPNIGTTDQTPISFIAIGLDSQSQAITLPAVGAGATYQLDLNIALPNLPSGIAFGQNDVVYLMATAFFYCGANLVVTSYLTTPKGFSNGVGVNGPPLGNNIAFDSFSARVQIALYAIAAVTAGQVITVRVDAVLWDKPR